MKYEKQKGFTLVELLIVIAIIGVLSSVVLISISNAKRKSNDASVKSGLNQARIQADLYYNFNGSYLGVCDLAKDISDPKGINKMVLLSGQSNSYTDPVNYNNNNSNLDVKCNSVTEGWAAQVPLKNETGYYCVDYTRKGIVTQNSIGNTTSCL